MFILVINVGSAFLELKIDVAILRVWALIVVHYCVVAEVIRSLWKRLKKIATANLYGAVKSNATNVDVK